MWRFLPSQEEERASEESRKILGKRRRERRDPTETKNGLGMVWRPRTVGSGLAKQKKSLVVVGALCIVSLRSCAQNFVGILFKGSEESIKVRTMSLTSCLSIGRSWSGYTERTRGGWGRCFNDRCGGGGRLARSNHDPSKIYIYLYHSS
jgi:hypothetical protein